MKKALMVGINYPNTTHALRGCINDVMLMNQLISSQYGFTVNNDRRVLTDASATTQNILDRLEWLVDGAQPGDVLFFHYSGHGSQVIDNDYGNLDEPDGLDEVICPIDMNWRDKIIKDDDLKRIFNKVPVGVNLTVLLDCCHSGDGIDSVNFYQPLGPATKNVDLFKDTPERNRLMPMPADFCNRGVGLNIGPKTRQVQTVEPRNQTGLLISGCQSDQISADAWIGRQWSGAATFFLHQTVKRYNYDIDYKTLVEQMNTRMTENNYTQRPELNGKTEFFTKKFLQPFV